MLCNVGKTEKMIRVFVALVSAGLGYTVSPWFYIVTAIMLVTSALGYCPISQLLGINACKK